MSDILEPVTLGVPVEYFGISLQNEGLTREKKKLYGWERQLCLRKAKVKRAEINPDAVQQYRTVQCYLVAGNNRICFIAILKMSNFPDQTCP